MYYAWTAPFIVGSIAHFFMSVNTQAVYQIDPKTVPLATRSSWCSSQTTACPLLCMQYPGQSSATTSNTCDPKSLAYSCVCQNGLSPNASEYSQTLPFFQCQEYGNQCVAACSGNSMCQADCREKHPCGAQNPTRVNTTTTPSAIQPTPSSTSGVAYNGLGGNASPSDGADAGKSGALSVLNSARGYSSAIISFALLIGFSLL